MQLTTVRLKNTGDIVRLRQVAAVLTRAAGMESFGQTRAVTACLELARNALQYAGGGRVSFGLRRRSEKVALTVAVSDQGPGIEDAQRILSGRSFMRHGAGLGGRGMGLGLRGVQRMAQSFDIQTGPEGTRVDIAFVTPTPAEKLEEMAKSATDALVALGKADPAAELAEQNRQLAEALAERELLINEVHHRTGNNLALILGLIQLSRRSAREPETERVLKELENRVHAVAKVHQELQQANEVDRLLIVPFLSSVAEHARAAFSSQERTVKVNVGGDDVRLASAAAVDIGLIVGELITNAFKHAFEGRGEGTIDIGFHADEEGGYLLSIADDGAGLPEGSEKPERSSSLGWRMIRAMVQRHDGVIEVNGDKGMKVRIRFPGDIAAQ